MCMQSGGPYYKKLSKWSNFEKLSRYIENDNLIDAYKIASEIGGNQMPRDLTLYLIHEHGTVFRYEPFEHLNIVPENYLYEACEDDLIIYVDSRIEEIKDNAFRYCSIKKLIISKNIKKIGKSALCINSGQIYYEGTKQEFFDLIFGKSLCFDSTRSQTIICSDGEINIKGY